MAISTESNATDEDTWANLPALERVRGFLTGHEAFADLLVKFEYLVHASLLHLAIYNKDETTVIQLLRGGMEVDAQDTRGVTALSLALKLVLDRFQPNVLDCMLKFREELEDGVDQSELDIDNKQLAVHFTVASKDIYQDSNLQLGDPKSRRPATGLSHQRKPWTEAKFIKCTTEHGCYHQVRSNI
jgi:hypothetical protein